MLAAPLFVLAVGVKVAVRVAPLPEMALRVPPLTCTSPTLPSQVNVAPGSSLKVNVIVAVSPALSAALLLVIASVGAVRSSVMPSPALSVLTRPPLADVTVEYTL